MWNYYWEILLLSVALYVLLTGTRPRHSRNNTNASVNIASEKGMSAKHKEGKHKTIKFLEPLLPSKMRHQPSSPNQETKSTKPIRKSASEDNLHERFDASAKGTTIKPPKTKEDKHRTVKLFEPLMPLKMKNEFDQTMGHMLKKKSNLIPTPEEMSRRKIGQSISPSHEAKSSRPMRRSKSEDTLHGKENVKPDDASRTKKPTTPDNIKQKEIISYPKKGRIIPIEGSDESDNDNDKSKPSTSVAPPNILKINKNIANNKESDNDNDKSKPSTSVAPPNIHKINKNIANNNSILAASSTAINQRVHKSLRALTGIRTGDRRFTSPNQETKSTRPIQRSKSEDTLYKKFLDDNKRKSLDEKEIRRQKDFEIARLNLERIWAEENQKEKEKEKMSPDEKEIRRQKDFEIARLNLERIWAEENQKEKEKGKMSPDEREIRRQKDFEIARLNLERIWAEENQKEKEKGKMVKKIPDRHLKIRPLSSSSPKDKFRSAVNAVMAFNLVKRSVEREEPPRRKYSAENHSIINVDGTVTKINKDDVYLFLYDLSGGKMAYYSSKILKEKIEAIWHSAIVVFGKEYYFGINGIRACPIAQTPSGLPLDIIFMGKTEISRREFRKYLRGLSEGQFKNVGSYNLVDNNCNVFAESTSRFLTGRGIPAHVLGISETVIAKTVGHAHRERVKSMNLTVLRCYQGVKSLRGKERKTGNATSTALSTKSDTDSSEEEFFGCLEEFFSDAESQS